MTSLARRSAVAFVAAIALTIAAPTAAWAAPVEPDPNQPANGVSAPGYRSDNTITPPFTPVQVPQPIVGPTDKASRTIVYTAYPYLAQWLHHAIGRQPLELRGAARLTFVNPVDGRTVVINPNGHCDFTDGHHLGVGTPLTPIRVDVGAFAVTIRPVSHRLTR